MMKRTLPLLIAALSFLAMPAFAGNDNPECLGSQCGTPKEEGGGCGCGCGCSVWVAYTDDGKTLSYTDDADGDGKSDDVDNCPFASNRDQLDDDGDGVGNVCDNCAAASNVTQLDADGDGKGDVCDEDIDGDTVANTADNCPTIPNLNQADADGDGLGDACDSDDDNDGIPDTQDNCPTIANPAQETINDPACNADADGDNVRDSADNCPAIANSNQADTDADGLGDVCDLDIDNDSIKNDADNCPGVANRDQLDDDGDGKGDACDDQYCVVVDPTNAADCLDPNSAFRVHAGGTVALKAGDKFRLPLFANRNNTAITYVWTVKSAPAGSRAAVINPEGVVTMSRHWEYAYQDGNVPSFTADVDGDYDIQLQGTLAFTDRAYPDNKNSASSLKLNASPDNAGTGSGPQTAGCSSMPLTSLGALALGLMALARRRR